MVQGSVGGCPLHLAVCSGGRRHEAVLEDDSHGDERQENASIRHVLEGAGPGWAEGQPPGPVPLAGHGSHPGKWSPPTSLRQSSWKVRHILPTDDVWFRPAARKVSPEGRNDQCEEGRPECPPRLPSRPIGSDSAQEASQGPVTESPPTTPRFPPGLGRLLIAEGVNPPYLGLISSA